MSNNFKENFGLNKIKGVNIGGWLVLESWMKGSLFKGLPALDETTYCAHLGCEEASRRLREHWDTFITEEDFAWIASHGLNAVRIPVGFWIFGSASGYPYHPKYNGNPHPFVDGGIERLDRAFDWAEKYNLKVLVDLHCAPGCQNGFDNGGISGVFEWHTKPEYIDFAILTLERLAERYCNRKALWGIQTLNEPRWDIPDDILVDFNKRAYHAIRKHCSYENCAVVFHDGFRAERIFDVFGSMMRPPEYQNVVLDAHRYQCFDDYHNSLDNKGNIADAEGPLARELNKIQKTYWTIVGEWSLGCNGPRTMEEHQAFYNAQKKVFAENVLGSFFWSYKIENSSRVDWSLRDAVEQGLVLQARECALYACEKGTQRRSGR